MNPIDPRELRNAFSSFMTGVTVVTAVSKTGEKVGFTANSFTSVSMDPPLLLVCPSHQLSSFDIFNSCEHFAVNILAQDQQDVSNTFASAKGDRFEQLAWYADDNGSPIIEGTVAHFSCSTFNKIPAGDHILLMGEVESFSNSEKLGLGYAKGGYFSLGMEHKAEELTHSNTGQVGAIVEYQGKVLMRKTAQGYALPQIPTHAKQSSQKAISQYLTEQGLSFEMGAVYSVYENTSSEHIIAYYRIDALQAHLIKGYDYIATEQLHGLEFVSPDIESMLHRYALEKQHGVFKFYIGDERQGEVR